MKIREIFEYEVETDNLDDVFKIRDYVNCVDGMTCPFWDGMIQPNITNHDLEIIEQ